MEKKDIYSILETAYFGDGSDEAAELEQLPNYVQGVDLFLDVGASLGPYTKRANELLEGATVIAIEADPVRVERLRELAAEWAKNGRNRLEVVACAVGREKGSVTFLTTDSNVSGSLALIADRTDGARPVEVPMRTLDDIIAEYAPDAKKVFVKMDIEGGEFMALSGAKDLLASDREVTVFVEMHAWGDVNHGKYPADCFKIMQGRDFEFTKIGTHYLFSHNIPAEKRLSYGSTIRFWKAKARLRKFAFLRWINRQFKGDPRRKAVPQSA